MKRRYSPAARRAHLRAMHRKPRVAYVQEVPVDAISKLAEAYFQGFLTRAEMVDLVLDLVHAPSAPQPAAQPEPDPKPEEDDDGLPLPASASGPAEDKPWWLHDISAEVDDAGEIHLTIDGQPQPAPKHEEGCQCHLCWAASLTPPSPPWEGGAA